ncbi:hydrolase 1, exosortase A system-associated [Massilia sp. PAMC28688]|uniref:hydrolase 1, exosortase A system-associated n=1 Tax=Massilia sp. PAMC28688 TaxID=2861283 RepID=UPI001C62F9B8|nr:hydrolase 1, exosortase A system-associated [Massilia sp. PAMC28688]QYF92957.1 hydrolase 1, exosortase A system-associated [Massilia sp. PAMC28688]
MNIVQRALQFACHGSSLVGIIDVPERPIGRGVLVLTSGSQYRVGSHRHYTLLARLLSPRGIAVMRFDCRGVGDSEGDPRPFGDIHDDIAAAIREFFMQVPELREVVIWGLGDGATAAALYGHLDERVRGMVLLNPWAGGAPGPQLPGRLSRLGEIGFWKKVGSRHAVAVDPDMPLAQRIIASLSCFGGAALVIVGGADTVGREFVELVERSDTPCRSVTIAGANHTFASREWRDEVAELSANWITAW